MQKPYTICIVGGGSRYTPGILQMLIELKDRFPLKRLTLYDNEPERQEKVGKYAKILFDEYYPNSPEVVYTTDPNEAFKDIDFALMQIRVGRLKMREQDEKIPLRNGRIGQETCGAGGFAYGLRSITGVVDIIKDIRKVSPEAWILNYSNPAAIVAEATKRIFPDDYRIINICDMPIGIMSIYAIALQKDPSELEPRYFGLNHYGWFTHIYDKKTGFDYLPMIRQIFSKPIEVPPNLTNMVDKSWMETFQFMTKMINDYDEFLPNTYLQYYLYPEHILAGENPDYTRANEVMDGHEKITFEMLEKVISLGKIKGTEFELRNDLRNAHGAYIVELAESIAENTGRIFLCMTENHGIISNLTEGMMVEVPCRVTNRGLEPLNVGNIPTFQKGLLENQYAYEKLTVDAYMEHSYQKALQALVLNRMVNDTDVARKILDELIEANKDYWPELH